MGQVYITSDWHLGHKQPFIWEPRGFKNQYEMNEAIITNHNKVVSPDDDVYVLGDLMLNDNEEGLRCIKQMKGKLHIIRGNHDSTARIQLYSQCHNVVEITEGQYFKYKKYHFYLSHYPCLTSNNDSDKPLKARMINLCGHSHVKDPFTDWDKGTIFHCEVDSNNCYPWNLETIIELIKQKELMK